MKVSPVTAALLLVSVVAAGTLGQFRDSAIADFQKPMELGRAAEVDNGQTIKPVDLSFGQFAVDARYSRKRSVISPARLVSVTFEFTTMSENEVGGMRCFLRLPGGNTSEALEDDELRFPKPGFRSTGTVIFEVSRDNLAGARVACVPTGVIVYREPEMLMPLGVTRANLDQVWQESANRRVTWNKSRLEVVR